MLTTEPVTDLSAGSDFRLAQYRREVFLRFYSFHLKHRSHPGGVYYVLPHLAEAHGWGPEERAWCAFLNGNTQNPVTTLLLMRAGPTPSDAEDVIDFWNARYADLEWDTDRRHHKARFADAVASYLALTSGRQVAYWERAAQHGWAGVWSAATAINSMGRLSAWSYLEYLRLLGVGGVPDAASLLLEDREGSRSHRNGLALVLGRDEWMWWKANPSFDGRYSPAMLGELNEGGEALLTEARRRHPGHPDVGRLTLESALCTYKSWHRPRRRYPNVYNDLLHRRLLRAQDRFGDRFAPVWQARAQTLPAHLRLEDNPGDPGAVAAKQNWYLSTGEVIMMEREWSCFANGFSLAVARGDFGKRQA